MNQHSWQTWLQQKTLATFSSDGKLLAKSPQNRMKPAITLLADEDILTLSGKDSVKFLQGQTTCDVEHLTEGKTILGACCTPKGRMIANFRLIKANQELLYLTLPSGQAENLQTSLGKYAVFYKANFSCQKKWLRIGLQAGDSLVDNLLADLAIDLSENHFFTVIIDEKHAEIWVQETEAIKLMTLLAAQYSFISTDVWKLDELERGIAWVQLSQTEKLLPQECNWELVNGVSFKKGCYTGQEIVARLHYRGYAKKRLQYFIVEAADQDIINQKIVNAENKSCGFVVNAIYNAQLQQVHLLANVRLDQTDQALFLESNTIKPLQHQQLPYPVV